MAAPALSSETASPGPAAPAVARWLGRRDYAETYAAMRGFTDARTPDTADELWFLEHAPVFTQGQAGRSEHLLTTSDIPVVASNRGGQVTYHAPGQLVVYVLLDLARLGYGIRSLVTRLEDAMVATLGGWGIVAQARADAPGVYVPDYPGQPLDNSNCRKIGSLGLRVSRGCSYHGLALNVAMDMTPFTFINPCGLAGMHMTQVAECGGPADVRTAAEALLPQLSLTLGLPIRNLIEHAGVL